MCSLVVSVSLALLAAGGSPRPARAGEPELQKAPVSLRYALWLARSMPRGTPGPLAGGKEGSSDRVRGYIPPPLDLSHVSGPVFEQRLSGQPFPPAYDLRLEGMVTQVKDQGMHGTCWTFACMGALESSMLRAGFGAYDLSEWHLAYYGYVPFNQSLFTAFTPGPPSYGNDPIFDQGGSDWMSAAILTRGTGAVNNRDCPYQPGSYRDQPRPEGDLPNGKEELSVPLERVYYLFNVDDPINAADVKYAIAAYGPVAITMAWEDADYDEALHTYRDPDANLWNLNHEVDIVGWDDNFPVDRFPAGNRPAVPGAWLVRNSWGQEWGDQGYFYLSYDSRVYDGTAFVGGARYTRRIRQYDPLGWCGSLGYGCPTAFCANIFHTERAETLTAVAFYTGAVNSTYAIQLRSGVQGDPGTGVPAGGGFLKGTLQAPGFHIVDLVPPVTMPAGSNYAVVVKLTTPGYDYPIPVQEPFQGYSENSRAEHGRSFMSHDGKCWHDLAPTCDGPVVCLKVFTQ
jgi:C1A family cysteine protease